MAVMKLDKSIAQQAIHVVDKLKTIEPEIPLNFRLEVDPRGDSYDEALAARVADPLWMLSRQWQFREFDGEDAGTPVDVSYRLSGTPVLGYAPGLDPKDGEFSAFSAGDIDAREVLFGSRMCLAGEMDEYFRAVGERCERRRIFQIAFHDFNFAAAFDARLVARQRAHLKSFSDKLVYKRRADEAGAAGQRYARHTRASASAFGAPVSATVSSNSPARNFCFTFARESLPDDVRTIECGFAMTIVAGAPAAA